MRRSNARRRMPAPGTILGLIAIVIALGGNAYAISLKKNSVKSKHIAPNQAKGVDVDEATLEGAKVQGVNAATVDGHDATCPAGTFLQSGVCFDNARRGNSDYQGAQNACVSAGGYLPSVSELKSIKDIVGDFGLIATQDNHWAESFDGPNDANLAKAVAVAANGTFDINPLVGPRQYRCAYHLVR